MIKRIIRAVIVLDLKFVSFFLFTYVLVVLFFNYVYYENIADNLMVGKMEPIYHFLLRYFNLIEGGEFRGFSKDICLIKANLLYPFIILYAVELLIYKTLIYYKSHK